jgi:hypothetical protein
VEITSKTKKPTSRLTLKNYTFLNHPPGMWKFNDPTYGIDDDEVDDKNDKRILTI